MNLPEGWPTSEMWDAFEKGFGSRTAFSTFERGFKAALEAAPTPPEQEDEPVSEAEALKGGRWINADDVDRLVRELDVLINGAAGAAKQAKLCDIVGQVAEMKRQEDKPVAFRWRRKGTKDKWKCCRISLLGTWEEINTDYELLYTRPQPAGIDALKAERDELVKSLKLIREISSVIDCWWTDRVPANAGMCEIAELLSGAELKK